MKVRNSPSGPSRVRRMDQIMGTYVPLKYYSIYCIIAYCQCHDSTHQRHHVPDFLQQAVQLRRMDQNVGNCFLKTLHIFARY